MDTMNPPSSEALAPQLDSAETGEVAGVDPTTHTPPTIIPDRTLPQPPPASLAHPIPQPTEATSEPQETTALHEISVSPHSAQKANPERRRPYGVPSCAFTPTRRAQSAQPRRRIEQVLGEKLVREEAQFAEDDNNAKPAIPVHQMSEKNQSLVDGLKGTLYGHFAGSHTASNFAEKYHLQHLNFTMLTKKKAAEYVPRVSSASVVKPGRSTPNKPTPTLSTYLQDFVKTTRDNEAELKRKSHYQSTHKGLKGSCLANCVTSCCVDEVYLKRLADGIEADYEKAVETVLPHHPVESREVSSAIFTKFEVFCEQLKKRANDAGEHADAAAVDAEATRKVLLERFVSHHLDEAKAAVSGQTTPPQSPPPPRKRLPRPHTAPPKNRPSPPSTLSPSPTQLPGMLMHSRAKSDHLYSLMARQARTTLVANQLQEEVAVLKKVREDGFKDDVAESEELIACLEADLAKMSTAGKELPGTRLRRERGLERSVRAEKMLAEHMKVHTRRHFMMHNRQQVAHQEHARMLFNRAPPGAREKILNIRHDRVVSTEGVPSASLLFMRPATQVPF